MSNCDSATSVLPANELPAPTILITGHDDSGKASIHSKRSVEWTSYDNELLKMAVAWTTTQFPVDLNNDTDIALHQEKIDSGSLGLVSSGGTVLRYVDFAPEYTCMMHRTQSLDYGIVIEGTIESVLDSGETQLMARGSVMVQRATMHAWKNPSKTAWARMVFVLQDCQPLFVAGQRFGEDLGRGTQGIPPSGNDTISP